MSKIMVLHKPQLCLNLIPVFFPEKPLTPMHAKLKIISFEPWYGIPQILNSAPESHLPLASPLVKWKTHVTFNSKTDMWARAGTVS